MLQKKIYIREFKIKAIELSQKNNQITLTLDNDKAFANHQSIGNKLDVDVYFTRPYISQEKGTVENKIGVIHQFFPKGTDLRKISEERIKTVERHLKNRPIRKFGYLSPIQ